MFEVKDPGLQLLCFLLHSEQQHKHLIKLLSGGKPIFSDDTTVLDSPASNLLQRNKDKPLRSEEESLPCQNTKKGTLCIDPPTECSAWDHLLFSLSAPWSVGLTDIWAYMQVCDGKEESDEDIHFPLILFQFTPVRKQQVSQISISH